MVHVMGESEVAVDDNSRGRFGDFQDSQTTCLPEKLTCVVKRPSLSCWH